MRYAVPPLIPEALRAPFWASVWGVVVVAVLAFDYWRWTKDDKSTLSDSIRWTFRTRTRKGRAAFVATLGLFARHILK